MRHILSEVLKSSDVYNQKPGRHSCLLAIVSACPSTYLLTYQNSPLVAQEDAGPDDPDGVCPIYKKKRPENLDARGTTYETNWTACRSRCGAVHKCVYWSYWNDHSCHLSLGGERLITVDEPVTTGKNPKLCDGK